MHSSDTSDEFMMYGYLDDGRLICVAQDEYDSADPIERDNPIFWEEQVADNSNVWYQ
jgi:hypothetical protein